MKKIMPKFRQMILVSLVMIIALNTVACGALLSAATSTPKNTPLPTLTSTQENTPLPAVTPTLLPYIPTMEGAIDMPGKYGGYKLRYQCFGEGTPTVIVEAGGGDTPVTSLTWKDVIQKTQSITRICIYNRMDLLTSQEIAENLHVLLSKIPVPGPYLFVAHSLGGWHARLFAHLYPKEVVGMILVDTTTLIPDTNIAYATAYPTYAPDEAPDITKNRISAADVFATQPPFNGVDLSASSEQVRQAGSLGDIPLIVISQSFGADDWFELPQVVRQKYAETLVRLEADLATLSSKGVYRMAKTSNHFISLYEPQIIIDAITQMVEEIRKQ